MISAGHIGAIIMMLTVTKVHVFAILQAARLHLKSLDRNYKFIVAIEINFISFMLLDLISS